MKSKNKKGGGVSPLPFYRVRSKEAASGRFCRSLYIFPKDPDQFIDIQRFG